ncbi:MAG: hypothetical protein ACLPUO_04910 [Streptosporangiaceae bacterium]
MLSALGRPRATSMGCGMAVPGPTVLIFIQRLALQAARRIGDVQAEAGAVNQLGVINLRQGHCEQAPEQLRNALELFRAAGDRLGEAHSARRIGAAIYIMLSPRQPTEPPIAQYWLNDPAASVLTVR